MFVLLSVVSMDSHHCVCCFLMLRRTLTIACVYFHGLLPLLSVISADSCHCFPCFFGILPFFLLLSLFLRPVAILCIAFLVSSTCCHSSYCFPCFFGCCHSAAILRTDFLVSSTCCHSACCYSSYCFHCFFDLLPFGMLLFLVSLSVFSRHV